MDHNSDSARLEAARRCHEESAAWQSQLKHLWEALQVLPLNIVDIYTLLERMQHVVAGAFAMWSKRGTAALAARTQRREVLR